MIRTDHIIMDMGTIITVLITDHITEIITQITNHIKVRTLKEKHTIHQRIIILVQHEVITIVQEQTHDTHREKQQLPEVQREHRTTVVQHEVHQEHRTHEVHPVHQNPVQIIQDKF